MPPDDVSLNKAAIIERSIRRMREEYNADPALQNDTHLDALTLNIKRACQAAIDLAIHVVAAEHLGIPQSSAESFTLLEQAGKVDAALTLRLAGMTGFRNIAIHQYQKLDLDIIHHIMRDGYQDFIDLCTALGLRISP
jgi:uncharacterized protein YutE (UPF0331/DUF86 family)